MRYASSDMAAQFARSGSHWFRHRSNVLVCSLVLIAQAACLPPLMAQSAAELPPTTWAIAIHGGAGEAEWLSMDAATAAAYRDSLSRALAAGTAVLQKQGTAVDAVQAAVEVLEDDPLFNAGRVVFFKQKTAYEMDASLMNGKDLTGGGVAGVHFTRHPIALARAVMEHTQYVLMTGSGADAFSKSQGLEQQPPNFFFTDMRWNEFAAVMRNSHRPVPPLPAGVHLRSQSEVTG